MDILAYSNIFLWVAVAALLVAVFALSRQIGILYERVAPMGALMMDAGPKVGDKAPQLDVPTIDGRTFALGSASGRNTLLFFLSPDCPICKKLIPIIKSLARSESKLLEVVFASDGEAMFHQKFRDRVAIREYTYLLSQDLGMAFRVSKLPYAVLLDAQGVVRGKGLVNSREQLESLLTAMELNVASAQEYFSRRAVGAKE